MYVSLERYFYKSSDHFVKFHAEYFENVSGLELNIDKCEGMWLGQLKDNSDTFEGISLTMVQ